jgi:Restriction endonuclease fold toxin 5
MEEASRLAGICPARGGAPRVIINPERLEIEIGDLVLKHTTDGGYLCIGFGRGARFLDAVRRDARLNAMIDVREDEVLEQRQDHPLWNDDGHLRRLGIALSIARAGDYDPDEPRDEHGRWSLGPFALSLFDPELRGKVLRALRMMLGRLDTAATVLNIVLAPGNKDLKSEGTIPDAAGVTYRYDQGTGKLTLSRQNDDGTTANFYSDRYDADGLFRDEEGNVIGRHLGDGVMLDATKIPGHKSQSKDQAQPQVCPDPGPDEPGWQGRSPRSLAYQAQISGLPPGLAINFKWVSLDGCRTEDGPNTGNLLEAKGEGFVWAMVGPDRWADFYTGVAKAMKQAATQNKAVRGTDRIIEWHFAEEQVGEYFRKQFARAGYDHIQVFYTPLQKAFAAYNWVRLT